NHSSDALILGDFNLSGVIWEKTNSLALTPQFSNSSLQNKLIDFISLNNLSQYNSCLNYKGKTLDLLLSSIPLSQLICPKPLIAIDPLHPPVEFYISLTSVENLSASRDFKFHGGYWSNFPRRPLGLGNRFGTRRRFDLQHDDLECMCISIPARTLGSLCDLNIICAYIPPNQILPSWIQKLCEILSQLFNSHPDDHFILAGDFNLPCIDWKQGHPIVLKKGSIVIQNTATELLNLTAFLGLIQDNFFFNTHNNLLDLIYSNTSLIINKSKSPSVKEDIFHPAIDICVIDNVLPSIKRTNTKRYLYNKVDYNAVNYFFSNYDWTSLECLPLHDAIDKFYSILYESISQFVPHKTVSHTYTYPM
ncbi:unnamed protein product, partial [Leptidea sinapis]